MAIMVNMASLRSCIIDNSNGFVVEGNEKSSGIAVFLFLIDTEFFGS